MPKFLLDANLSPETVTFLRELGYEARRVHEIGLGNADDLTIIKYAEAHGLVVITFDLDFGHLFHLLAPHHVGIVILRRENQTVEFVNATLKRLLESSVLNEPGNEAALVIVDESSIRIRI